MKLPEPFGYMNAGQLSELLTNYLPYGYVYPSKALGASGRLYTEAQMREMYWQGRDESGNCHWVQPDYFDMPGVYSTSCGGMWSFTEGNREYNKLKFCPYCGGVVKEDENETDK